MFSHKFRLGHSGSRWKWKIPAVVGSKLTDQRREPLAYVEFSACGQKLRGPDGLQRDEGEGETETKTERTGRRFDAKAK